MEDNRPIRPMKENDQNIDYISEEKLEKLPEDQLTEENISLNIGKLVETPKWLNSFNALIFFRRLNKQNPTLMKTIVPKIIKNLLKLSNSIRSGLSKESIILVGEIIKNYILDKNSETDLDIIKQLFNIIFQCSFSNKKFIKDTSNQIIENAIINNNSFFNLEIICVIIELMKDKKTSVCDCAFITYEKIMQQIVIREINDTTLWNKFFSQVDSLYALKKEIYTKKTVKILEYVRDVLSKEKLDELLTNLNRSDDIKKYEQWITLGSKKNTMNMSLKDFLKSKKNNKQEQSK